MNKHSIVLEKKVNGRWEYAHKPDGMCIVIDKVSLETIAWLNTACKADWRWSSND